jgi:alanyl-tRNA synthetase
VLYRLFPVLAKEMNDIFPELEAQQDFIVRVLLEEEKSFLRTLESGLKRFDQLDIKDKTVAGAQAFELLDTYGFPIDLTRLLAREKGLAVDEEGFTQALAEQKARSRKDAAKQVGDWMVLRDEADVAFVRVRRTRNGKQPRYQVPYSKGKRTAAISGSAQPDALLSGRRRTGWRYRLHGIWR